MIETITAIVGIAVPFTGWVLAIQSKVSAQEVQLESQKEILNVQLANIDYRLGRIERALNGHLTSLKDH